MNFYNNIGYLLVNLVNDNMHKFDLMKLKFEGKIKGT